MPPHRRQTGNTPLQNRLILHRFICQEFGYEDMRAMLDRLRDAPAASMPAARASTPVRCI